MVREEYGHHGAAGLGRRRLTDGGLEALGALGRLQRMVLADQGQLSDRGIAAAGTRLPLLRRLALRQCSGITGVCASVFAGAPLPFHPCHGSSACAAPLFLDPLLIIILNAAAPSKCDVPSS